MSHHPKKEEQEDCSSPHHHRRRKKGHKHEKCKVVIDNCACPGPQGPRGFQGNQGARGFQGFQGTSGVQGSIGLQGDVGAQGSQGDIGLQGESGPQGDRGFQGDIGLQGSIGLQGYQGDVGETGAQGFQGDVGEAGEQGPQGVRGEIGAQGFQGDVGDAGPQGFQGDSGEQGLRGFQGDVGEIGPQGFQGDQGPPGGVGPAGLGAIVPFGFTAAGAETVAALAPGSFTLAFSNGFGLPSDLQPSALNPPGPGSSWLRIPRGGTLTALYAAIVLTATTSGDGAPSVGNAPVTVYRATAPDTGGVVMWSSASQLATLDLNLDAGPFAVSSALYTASSVSGLGIPLAAGDLVAVVVTLPPLTGAAGLYIAVDALNISAGLSID